jgi:glycosyltransferase involved in cell wall biosynthesis
VHEPDPGETLQQWLAVERAAARRPGADLVERTPAEDAQAEEDVTVICVTNRPAMLRHAVDNVARQTVRPRLILVTNADDFDDDAVEVAMAPIPHAVRVHLPSEVSLGECLDAALDRCDTRFVAKMDDDDHYDDTYLADQLAALRSTGVGVVGKHTCLAYLAGSDTTIVRFPGREHQFVGFVGGGTIVIDREQVGHVRFPHRDTGEDSGFLARCEDAGALVLSTGCLGYVQYRGSSNTWCISDEAFAAGAMTVGRGSPDGCFSTLSPNG